MIKENILGKCFRSSSSCAGPRISPLTAQYGCPRPSLSIITSRLQKPTKARPRSSFVIPCTDIQAPRACFEHSNFFKVTSSNPRPSQLRPEARPRQKDAERQCTPKRRTEPPRPKSNYELFNRNNLNIRYWSWNYRGCWPIHTVLYLCISSKVSSELTRSSPLRKCGYSLGHRLRWV